MRKIQKILGGIFLTGVLIGGVGTGIAVVEYSSLIYGGEKLIGEDSLVTKDFDFDFELDGRTLEVAGGRFWQRDRIRDIEIDNTVPAGTVRFEVTYNEKTVTPYLEFEAYEGEETVMGDALVSEELLDMRNEDEAEPEQEAESESADSGEPMEQLTDSSQTPEEDGQEAAAESYEIEKDSQTYEEIPGKIGTLWLTANYHERGFAILMENKNYVLAELKQGKISSYDVAYITDIKIKVNQETAPYIESHYVMH